MDGYKSGFMDYIRQWRNCASKITSLMKKIIGIENSLQDLNDSLCLMGISRKDETKPSVSSRLFGCWTGQSTGWRTKRMG